MFMKQKVVVGLSGGVDSSVAALLLKESGYDVIGVTMKTWEQDGKHAADNGGCGSSDIIEDARRVAKTIGIPYYVVDFKKEFHDNVINYFCETYCKGATPNPCIACNRYVKWEALLKKANSLGAQYLATGHYARIGQLENGRYAIRNSETARKDQTYALYNLTQEQLKQTLLPVGEYSKDEIRKIAEKNNLPVAYKKDSQDICFVPDHDYARFIKDEKGVVFPAGNFVNKNGDVLGKHKGIIHYTVGQRKGLGLSLGKPSFVTQIRPETNEVVIGFIDDIMSDTLIADNINYMGSIDFETEGECVVKIRYNHPGALARIREIGDGKVEVKFNEPQKGIAKGQAAVFYKGDYVLGGGTILN